jgi:hypothetical protein
MLQWAVEYIIMKTPLICIFCFTLLISNSTKVLAQDTFQRYDSKEELESDVKKIIEAFDVFIRDMGIEPPYVPTVTIQTGPYLIKWDEPNKSIILPFWDELFDEQKELFKTLKGEYAEEFFISMFNWFLIPHELGHFINPMEDSLSPYNRERAANEFAIAFYLSQKESQEKLEYLEKSVPEVLDLLPKIEFNNYTEEEYFNMNYTKLGSNPNAYGYFQFKFIQDILENKEDIDILHYFKLADHSSHIRKIYW